MNTNQVLEAMETLWRGFPKEAGPDLVVCNQVFAAKYREWQAARARFAAIFSPAGLKGLFPALH